MADWQRAQKPYRDDIRWRYRVPIGRVGGVEWWVYCAPAAFNGWEVWGEPPTVTLWANVPMWFETEGQALAYIRRISVD